MYNMNRIIKKSARAGKAFFGVSIIKSISSWVYALPFLYLRAIIVLLQLNLVILLLSELLPQLRGADTQLYLEHVT